MLAVLKLGDDAYPLAIADEIARTTARHASRPSVLITLQRLEDKGLLTSRYSDPLPVLAQAARFLEAGLVIGLPAASSR